VNSENFARFLELLSPDTEEAGRRYTCLQKKLQGYFSLKGISDPEDAADETLDRAILKISSGTIVPDIDNYCRGIARNIVKERLRLMKRENAAFHQYVEDLGASSAEQVERIYNLLQPCFEQLAVEDQQLLLMYCEEIQGRARAEHRRQVAATMKITMLALRVRVTRLRTSLSDCVQKRFNSV
jgi:DNA-directed RNA polymerase specialized sigma24 family protein